MATRPNPLASLLSRISISGRSLVSGKTLAELIRILMADRVIAGDNLEETMASPDGRTWRATADGDGGGCNHPWRTTVKKEKNQWIATVARNGGQFHNVDGENEELNGWDKDGKMKLYVSAYAKTAIMLCWEYTYENDGKAMPYITTVTYSSPDDSSVQPIINGSPAKGGVGQSQVALACIKQHPDDPDKMVVTQLTHTSLRAAWTVGWVDKNNADEVTPAQLATCIPGVVE